MHRSGNAPSFNVFGVGGWKRRFFSWKKTKKASYTIASISVFGRFSVDNRGKRIKKYAVFDWKCIIVDRWKQNENASVVENILLRFRRDENGYFQKRVSVVGALVNGLNLGVSVARVVWSSGWK